MSDIIKKLEEDEVYYTNIDTVRTTLPKLLRDARVQLVEKNAEIEHLQNLISEMGQHLIDHHHCGHDWSRLPSVVDKEEMFGFLEGEVCNRDGCDGIIEYEEVENCNCFNSAPCSACVDAKLNCPKCDWERDEE